MSKNVIARRRQGGFTLIELIVVIVIIVAAAAAIISRQRSTAQTSQVQSEQSNLQSIVSKVNSSFSARPSYSGVSTSFLLAQGAFPTQMVNGSSVVNVWGGAVTVAAGTGNTSFDITYAGVPSSACIELVSNVSRFYSEITVGSTKVKNGAALADLATTQTACTAADPVSLTFNAS